MIIYRVWSELEDGTQVIEAQRTDKASAKADVQLIKDISHRAAWIEEVDDEYRGPRC